MVLKQERRVNAASVAKRQSLRAAAQKKLEIEEAAREMQKAWSVGADERSDGGRRTTNREKRAELSNRPRTKP